MQSDPSPHTSLAATFFLCVIAPLIAALAWGVEWRWVWLGALSWVIGLAVKIPADAWIGHLIRHQSITSRAAAGGLVSAGTELGAAAIVFLCASPPAEPFNAILTFATAAGVTEVMALLVLIPFEPVDRPAATQWALSARTSFLVRHQFLIERTIALAGHIGARGFFILALYAHLWLLLPVPLLTFAGTDGRAIYGVLSGWNWFAPRRAKRFYGFCALIAALELLLFAWLVSRLS